MHRFFDMSLKPRPQVDMKTLVLLLALVSLPIISIAQEHNPTVSTEISIEKGTKNNVEVKTVKQDVKSNAILQ